jgi:hypothetical protein
MRALAGTWGARLLGHVVALRRTRAAGFEPSVTMKVEEAADAGSTWAARLPIEAALGELAVLAVG